MIQFPLFPKKIMIQTTSFCNAHCTICPYDSLKDSNSMGVMSDTLFEKIINECSKYTPEAILLYLMNEPLMDKKISDRINYTKSLNPESKVYIVTNGSLLTDDLIDSLVESSADEIVISILGHKDSYTQAMGLNFKKTIDGVRKLILLAKKFKKGKSFLKIKLTCTPGLTTEKEKKSFSKFWSKMGVLNEIIEHPISRAGNVPFLTKDIDYSTISGCNSMWEEEMIEILYTGQVVLCCMDWKRETELGNINNQSLFDVWNGDIYKKYRNYIYDGKKLPSHFICRKCELAKQDSGEKNV